MGEPTRKSSQSKKIIVVSQSSTRRTHSQVTKSGNHQTLQQSVADTQDLTQNVNKCLRYILYRARSKMIIRKTDLQKNVRYGKSFDPVIEKTTEILKDVYGLDLYIGAANPKQYLVSNMLPLSSNNESEDKSLNVHKILLMLVLSHVFMSGESVSQVSMFQFLHSIKIDVDKKHCIFGNVKEYITTTLVKQNYLTSETDPNNKSVTYHWGPRAEHEVSKHSLLKLVSKIYENRASTSWKNQFQAAQAQQDNENRMEE